MKLIKALVVMLVAVGMILPAVAVAEDRLSLSGEMRVRAFHTDYDWDGREDNDTATWANQRLRIAGKIAVAEGVSVTFRTDITEGTNWGDHSSFGFGPGNPERSNGFGHGRSGSQQQWDRAHLDITKGIYHLRAGQQFIGTGGTWAIDTQDSGLALDIATGAADIKLFGIVDKDNASKTESDGFLYGVIAGPKTDNFSLKLFAAGYDNHPSVTGIPTAAPVIEIDSNEQVFLLGASGSVDVGVVKLFGELDFFTGDYKEYTDVGTGEKFSQDAFGTQLLLDASMAATDAVTVGGQFFYAMGDDEDKQYVLLGNSFNGWDPIMDVGTSLSNEEIVFMNVAGGLTSAIESALADVGLTADEIDALNISVGNARAFDWTGLSAGAVGGRLYASTKFGKTALGASAAYMTVEEDALIDADVMALAAGLKYDILENTSFQLQLQYTDGKVDKIAGESVDGDFDAFEAGTGIFVKF